MKRHGNPNGLSELILTLFFLSSMLFFPFKSNAYVIGDVDGDGKISLTEAIHALQVISEGRSPLTSKTINVPGDVPTIQQAIDAAAEGDTIKVAAGTYTENIIIKTDLIWLEGAGQDGTIIKGSSFHVVTVDGANSVSLEGFKVEGGNHGVYGTMGATFSVRNVSVENVSGNGIRVSGNSMAIIEDCSFYSSGEDGIKIYMNSGAVLQGTIISSNNTSAGLSVQQTSSVLLAAGSTVTVNNNTGNGVNVKESSSLLSHGSQLTANGNQNDGVVVMTNSSANLNSTESWFIENGDRRGMIVFGSSHCNISAASTLEIRNNKERGLYILNSSSLYAEGLITVTGTTRNEGFGVFVSQNSTLTLIGSTVLIENNSGDGINVIQNSSVMIIGERSVVVRNNQGDGISFSDSAGRMQGTSIIIQNNGRFGVLADGSDVLINAATIGGNTSYDVSLEFGTRGTFLSSNFAQANMHCGDGVMIRGDRFCP